MRRILADPELAAQHRSAGRERAERFGWEQAARCMLACYEELAAE